jgi:predicted enzyme related to lactoylglutathione lyase
MTSACWPREAGTTELEGETQVEGPWVDRTVGLDDVRADITSVDDIDDVVARLRGHGAELLGEIAQYEDTYRLCFLRGPEGIIIGVAEQLS